MRTVLSFDGGGVRGAISVAFLEAIEKHLGANDEEPIANKIDLAGGTSTGAIIAGAIALGYSAKDIRSFYMELAPKIFVRSLMRIPGIQSVFDASRLKQEILEICGNRTLESADLKTSFALVMKRMDTGSPWIVSNNPNAPYWNDPEDGSYLGNRHYRLADLIRASTAAPHYFQPEAIKIVEDEEAGLFVDGGVTPHNNPALALLQLITIPAHGFAWPTGVKNLRIISIGTGSFRDRMDPKKASRTPAIGLAIKALAGLITDSQTQTLALMQILGRPKFNWVINSEIGDLAEFNLHTDPLFEFARYDVRLVADWLKEYLDMNISSKDLERVRQMDNPDMIELAYDIGKVAAEKMVKAEHFETSEVSR
ncbi:MAG: patatin-like phospholipase family protein [Pseudomonadota bacterium]